MSRKRLVAGNWKMNMTPQEGYDFAKNLAPKLDTAKSDVAFCVPFLDILSVVGAVGGTGVAVGAQNMYFEEKGAFTGEISPAMLVNSGVQYVILGHSERRQFFGETDETVNKKIHKAIEHGLIPIVCVGESLEQREKNITIELVKMQVKAAFYGVEADKAAGCVIAYEPIWAIGTGKTATSQQAEEVCAAIRECVKEIYDERVANELRILYGGSVSAANAQELFAMENIDGGLVGGASLKDEFEIIVNV